VNISPGHNLDPELLVPRLLADPRRVTSDKCRHAVEVLRERYGVADASPYSYLTGLSPHLNILCEPPEFLTDVERRVFEPVAFFGCLTEAATSAPAERPALSAASDQLRIYASFGTVVFKYFSDIATAALIAMSECLAGLPQARLTISLGGASLDPPTLQRIERENVTVKGHVDQWAVLGESDLFITHNGMNSTHEAIFNGVPMLSYPFMMDQPPLARRCQEFGLTIPLSKMPRAPVTAAQVRSAIDNALDQHASLDHSLKKGQAWERDVIANRASVIGVIEALL
jgi:UDP:flavonoid glycosyltransferase YjiC (YdhE family)